MVNDYVMAQPSWELFLGGLFLWSDGESSEKCPPVAERVGLPNSRIHHRRPLEDTSGDIFLEMVAAGDIFSLHQGRSPILFGTIVAWRGDRDNSERLLFGRGHEEKASEMDVARERAKYSQAG